MFGVLKNDIYCCNGNFGKGETVNLLLTESGNWLITSLDEERIGYASDHEILVVPSETQQENP